LPILGNSSLHYAIDIPANTSRTSVPPGSVAVDDIFHGDILEIFWLSFAASAVKRDDGKREPV
jgi:hypothetical protein